MSEPLRLMVYDRTCNFKGPIPWLSLTWEAGGRLYRARGELDHHYGASNWIEALQWLAAVETNRPIGEIQYWGHGKWGRVLLAGESLDVGSLDPDHPFYLHLQRIKKRFVPDAGSRWWFRTCETFGRKVGHEFARAWADFFDAEACGHTYVIAWAQSGLHRLRPGETPDWSVAEGLPAGEASPSKAVWSRWTAPNTISFLTSRIPDELD